MRGYFILYIILVWYLLLLILTFKNLNLPTRSQMTLTDRSSVLINNKYKV